MTNALRAKAPETQSEEDFRTIVSNITGIAKDDPIFDKIEEQDKRVIKSAKKAIDSSRIRATRWESFNHNDLPRNHG